MNRWMVQPNSSRVGARYTRVPFANAKKREERKMRYLYVMVAGLLIGLSVSLVWSQDDGEAVDWQKWAQFHAPGENHKWLAEDAGEWEITARMTDSPEDAPAMKGRSTMTMMWGLYLQEEYELDMGSHKMTGVGHIGFDNGSKKFKSAYVVNVGTDLPIFTGSRSDDGNSLTLSTEVVERALDGMKVKNRVVITRNGDDVRTKEIFTTYGDQPERKMWDMTYTRKK